MDSVIPGALNWKTLTVIMVNSQPGPNFCRTCCSGFNAYKSMEPDGIHPRVWKAVWCHCETSLNYFSITLRTGRGPTWLEADKCHHSFQKGQESPSNYSPVSLNAVQCESAVCPGNPKGQLYSGVHLVQHCQWTREGIVLLCTVRPHLQHQVWAWAYNMSRAYKF